MPAEQYKEWTIEKDIFVPMRDGIHLDTDVWLPKGVAGKLPTLLVRTPYEKDKKESQVKLGWAELFVKQGFAIVIQNERGRNFSEGDYQNILQGAGSDGYDTVEWIVKQPWSNGKVGAMGCSSSAEHQPRLAATNPPGLAALLPISAGNGMGDIPGNSTQGGFYRGGVPLLQVWGEWYAHDAPSERLLLPPNSSQAQRMRLRKSYSSMGDADTGWSELKTLDHLPSRDVIREEGGALTAFDKYINWGPSDPRWHEAGYINAGDKPRVPALFMEGWHDPGVVETTRLFQYLQDQDVPDQYLIIGAGPHCAPAFEWAAQPANLMKMADGAGNAAQKWGVLADIADQNPAQLKMGDLDVMDARYNGMDLGYSGLFLDWFAFWLKGEHNNVTQMPKVQLYVLGKGWITGSRWPLTGISYTEYYLGRPCDGVGSLSLSQPGEDGESRYIYDPGNPTPSLANDYATPATDQRPIESRKDVLVYSTGPLDRPVTIAGPIEVTLYVSSSAKDTDFMVKLTDVYPSGKSVKLTDDAFRLRYREGFDKKVSMQAGQVYKITLTNMAMAIQFAKGHRIRVDVSSSSFPWYERNLNTGGNNYDETSWVVAENSVHYGPRYPSHVVLPVLPDQ